MASASHVHEDRVQISTKALASRDEELQSINRGRLAPNRRRLLFEDDGAAVFDEESGIFRRLFQVAFATACRSEEGLSDSGRSFTSSRFRRAWESLVSKAAPI
jgi:hypothetical protein